MLKRWAAWPRGNRWLAWIAAVVLGLAIAWALFVPAADWLAHHDVGSATGPLHETAVDNARGRLLTLGAGLFAAGALAFTALNFRLLRRNSEQADQWQRRTHELTEQGQVTDRYTKAIEQLGSDKLDVRIGGIYALERIARDSARDHPTVMEVLTAFIREHSREQWPPPGPDGAEPAWLTRPDVLAALTVIGRRDEKHDGRPIDLSGTDLTDAELIGARLGGAFFVGTILAHATLGSAHLADADLTDADLTDTILTRADLTRATLFNARLTGAKLGGAKLGAAFLGGADLRGAFLGAANLGAAYLGGADLTEAKLGGADLTGADLTDADFTDADLTDVIWPEDAPVPEGWERDAGSGLLRAAGTGPETAGAN